MKIKNLNYTNTQLLNNDCSSCISPQYYAQLSNTQPSAEMEGNWTVDCIDQKSGTINKCNTFINSDVTKPIPVNGNAAYAKVTGLASGDSLTCYADPDLQHETACCNSYNPYTGEVKLWWDQSKGKLSSDNPLQCTTKSLPEPSFYCGTVTDNIDDMFVSKYPKNYQYGAPYKTHTEAEKCTPFFGANLVSRGPGTLNYYLNPAIAGTDAGWMAHMIYNQDPDSSTNYGGNWGGGDNPRKPYFLHTNEYSIGYDASYELVTIISTSIKQSDGTYKRYFLNCTEFTYDDKGTVNNSPLLYVTPNDNECMRLFYRLSKNPNAGGSVVAGGWVGAGGWSPFSLVTYDKKNKVEYLFFTDNGTNADPEQLGVGGVSGPSQYCNTLYYSGTDYNQQCGLVSILMPPPHYISDPEVHLVSVNLAYMRKILFGEISYKWIIKKQNSSHHNQGVDSKAFVGNRLTQGSDSVNNSCISTSGGSPGNYMNILFTGWNLDNGHPKYSGQTNLHFLINAIIPDRNNVYTGNFANYQNYTPNNSTLGYSTPADLFSGIKFKKTNITIKDILNSFSILQADLDSFGKYTPPS